ncbi:acyltransferase [Neorhizobium sp. P12A]|uniref:acyltransferase family protein n=1 Tax=Neorhizobium sp. P12A TaxID=2268027 RepID=UPI00165D87F4|nr:acyltransferase [Neorhizobium sp. P12A]
MYEAIFQKPKPIAGLDGVRGLCVLLVLTDHARLTNALETGTLAVWVFFALSGFLIVPILFRARLRLEADVTDSLSEILLFNRDRILRIFPIYYIALVIASILGPRLGSSGNIDKLQGSETWLFTYTTNLYIGFIREGWLGPLSHLWTLAIEQQFYLLFPLIFIFIPARRWQRMLVLSTIILILVSAILFFNNELQFRVNSLSGFYAICFGGLCGLWAQNNARRWIIPFPGVGIAAVGAALIVQHIVFTLAGLPNFTLLIAPLLAGLLIVLISVNQNNVAIRLLELPALRGVGVVSYGFYLFHGFVLGPSGRFISEITALDGGVAFKLLQVTCAFFVTMIVSMVSFLYFEKKLLQLKRRPVKPILAKLSAD